MLLSNDCVIVPDFGGFTAYHIEARKDESDGSILPPMRSIGFNPKLTLNDSLLAQSYVETYDISYPDAVNRIEDEVREIKQHIENEGEYTFKGIGTITLNEEGHYEFNSCESGILSPELYGLGNFKMATADELKRALQEQLRLQDKGLKDDDNTNSIATSTDSDTENSKEEKHNARYIAIWRNLAAACAASIAFLLIPTPLANNTQYKESGVDTRLLDAVMPKNITTGEQGVKNAVKNTYKQQNKSASIEGNCNNKVSGTAKPLHNNTETEEAHNGYSIVLASRVTKSNANAYVSNLHKRGYEKAFVYTHNNKTKVLFGYYANQAEAQEALNKLSKDKEFAEAWILKTNS